MNMCVLVYFHHCKLTLDHYKLSLNMDDEIIYLNESLTLKKLNVKFMLK